MVVLRRLRLQHFIDLRELSIHVFDLFVVLLRFSLLFLLLLDLFRRNTLLLRGLLNTLFLGSFQVDVVCRVVSEIDGDVLLRVEHLAVLAKRDCVLARFQAQGEERSLLVRL